jgi:hypothetical protein
MPQLIRGHADKAGSILRMQLMLQSMGKRAPLGEEQANSKDQDILELIGLWLHGS